MLTKTCRIDDHITLELNEKKTWYGSACDVNFFVNGDPSFSEEIPSRSDLPDNELPEVRIGDLQRYHFRRFSELAEIVEDFNHLCSQLKTWSQHDYDTLVIPPKVIFPILNHLAGTGKMCSQIFKREIKKQLRSGTPEALKFLINKCYIGILSDDEVLSNLFDERIYTFLSKIYEDEIVRSGKALKSDYWLTFWYGMDFPSKEFEEWIDDPSRGDEIGNPRIIVKNRNEIAALNLNDKKLEQIPEILLELLEEIPEMLFESLEELDLSGNNLKELPGVIGKLKNLKRLDLSGNNLKELPDALLKLKNLRRLFLCENQITSIPSNLEELESLEQLDLSLNYLDSVPDSIYKLADRNDLRILKNRGPLYVRD